LPDVGITTAIYRKLKLLIRLILSSNYHLTSVTERKMA
jgi:hypothetical protein